MAKHRIGKAKSLTGSRPARAAPRTGNSGSVVSAQGVQSSAPLVGYVEAFGYASAPGGWLFNGWIPRPLSIDHLEPVEFMAQYDKSQTWGRAMLAFYQRDDLEAKFIGVIAFVPGDGQVLGALRYIAFALQGFNYHVRTGHFTDRLLDQDMVDRVRLNLVNHGFANHNREHLLGITHRRGFAGSDTLSALSEPVLLEIDEAILCPPGGVLLRGWYLAVPGTVRAIRVRSGAVATQLWLEDAILVDRPDVIAAVGPDYGFSELRCGFVAFVAAAVSPTDVAYLEIELESGEVGYRKLRLSKRMGLDAIRRILECVEIRYGEIDSAFDKTVGPAVVALNEARLRTLAATTDRVFGALPPRPRVSVIVPLYGRVDFVEYQLAMFSRQWDRAETELIYVLDDPAKRRELEFLLPSLFERFQIPFRLLSLPVNGGFSVANNVGLRAARGEFVCFLNSDIFPITPDWMARLLTTLRRHPDIGIIGARLLFEDGSVQHEGCDYRSVSEFGDWMFVEHLNKGCRPVESRAVERREAITGACMLLKLSLARELDGFDEQFVIGDFEDSDLCLKVKARGLSVAIDMSVELYHLERQSQHAPQSSWRKNLTLYNAWVHQRRWFTPSGSSALPGRR